MTGLVHRCADKPARLSVAAPARPTQPDAARGYFAQDAADRCEALARRQREVLVLLSKGFGNREIAAALGISPNVVREHKQAVYKVLEVCGAVEAAVLAAKAGLV